MKTLTGRTAVIDIGTNTTRLAVFDAGANGNAELICEENEITRLGEGFGSSAVLKESAVKRTIDVLEKYHAQCITLGVSRIEAVGTAVLRKAKNSEVFLEAASKIGIVVRVVAGEEEARLVFQGVASGLSPEKRDNLMTVDIGGGSTEFTTGRGGGFENAVSIDVGAVTMTERYLKSDPPTDAELLAMENFVRETVRSIRDRFPAVSTSHIVGVAGTITTLAALDLDLPKWNPARVHGHILTVERADNLYRKLAGMTIGERRCLPSIEEKRADIIAAGAGILSVLFKEFAIDRMEVSLRDIRYGVLEKMKEEQ